MIKMKTFRVLDLGSNGRAAKGYQGYRKTDSAHVHAVGLKNEKCRSLKDNVLIERNKGFLPNYLSALEQDSYDHIHLHMLDNKQVGHDGFVFLTKSVQSLLKEDGIFFFSFDDLFFDESSFMKGDQYIYIFEKIPKILRFEGFRPLLLDLSLDSILPIHHHVYARETFDGLSYLDIKTLSTLANDFSFYYDIENHLGRFLGLFSDYLNFNLCEPITGSCMVYRTYSYECRPNFIIAQKNGHQST